MAKHRQFLEMGTHPKPTPEELVRYKKRNSGRGVISSPELTPEDPFFRFYQNQRPLISPIRTYIEARRIMVARIAICSLDPLNRRK